MMEFLDPKRDFTFKKVFAEHPDVLLDMLNAILPLEVPIASLQYFPPELLPGEEHQKVSVVDVRCIDNLNRHFIVEMQVVHRKNIQRRMLYNASKIITKQLYPSQDFANIRSVYSLCFLEGTMYPKRKEWFHHFKINHQLWPEESMEGAEWVYVELGKWRKLGNFNGAIKRDIWLSFLSEPEKLNHMLATEYENQYKEARKALSLIDKTKYTPEQLFAMERNADELYFAWEGVMMEIEDARKETENRILAIIHDLKNGVAVNSIAEKHQVEVDYVKKFL